MTLLKIAGTPQQRLVQSPVRVIAVTVGRTEAVSGLSSEGLGKSEGLGNEQHILLYVEHVNYYGLIGLVRL